MNKPASPTGLVKSPLWFKRFAAAAAAALAVYALGASFSQVRPGNWWGLSYGWAAALLMVGAAAYAWRTRSPDSASRRGLGSARDWLQFHVYGGTLCLLFIFMHIGFRLPTGGLTWALFLLSVWTILSGLLGVGVQKYYPRVLASGLSVEALYERIPELVAQLREKAESCVEESGEALGDFYRDRLAGPLREPRFGWAYFIDIRGGIDSRLREFDYLAERVGEGERTRLKQLRDIYRAKLEMDAHYTVQRLLRGWLVLHAPLSFALLALLALHVLTVLYY